LFKKKFSTNRWR